MGLREAKVYKVVFNGQVQPEPRALNLSGSTQALFNIDFYYLRKYTYEKGLGRVERIPAPAI